MPRPILLSLSLLLSTQAFADSDDYTAGTVKVGTAAVELQAADSMNIAGGIGPGHAQGQDGLLRAVATVIQGPPDDTRVAIVALDLIAMPRDSLDAVSKEIERKTGIPFDHILINCTHTHHAPATVRMHGVGPDPRFLQQVRGAVVEAVVAADAKLATSPATHMHFIMGQEATVGQNSRIEMRDGTISWIALPGDQQLRPTGPFDPAFPVMAFSRPDGALSAVIFGHSTHSIGTRHPEMRSPSFYGLVAQTFEQQSGAVTTFLEGASGSTHNISLGAVEAERGVLDALRYSVDQAPSLRVEHIDSLKREVTVKVRDFNEKKEDRAVTSYCEAVLCDQVMGLPKGETAAVFRRQRAELAPHRREERKTWISVTRIGDVAIVGVPAELFTQLGIDIKQRSPFRHTIIAELANDYIGYVGNADAYRLGGYQMWMGHHSWSERGTGELLVNESVKLLNELHAQ